MTKKVVIVVSWEDNRTKALCSALESALYRPIFVSSLSNARTQLEKECQAVLLIDLDQIALDNRFLKELRKEYPVVGLIGLSSRRFHQELEEAMSRYIDACFEKSEDYEDLLYWLKAVFDPSINLGSRSKGSRL